MKRTILVIEDDPMTTRLVELTLSSAGYQVGVAANGLKGLQMAQTNPPDLVVLDLMLPGQDGFEVLNRLRAGPRTADVPVVIVSSKSQRIDKATAADLGANAYLTKPFQRPELLQTIETLLREKPGPSQPSKACTVLLSPQANEEAPVAAYTGLALAAAGSRTTLVDLRPFSVEHSLLLSISPPLNPVPVASLEEPDALKTHVVQHTGGLELLNNLEGSGEAGQITAADAKAVLDLLAGRSSILLVDVHLYPFEVLEQTAACCDRFLLVSQSDKAGLASTRTALSLMERAHIRTERIKLVPIVTDASSAGNLAGLQDRVMHTIPASAGRDDPAYHRLADMLKPQAGENAV